MQQPFTRPFTRPFNQQQAEANQEEEVREVRIVKEITSTISSKGQVTVPVEVRKRLGLSVGEKISFVIEDGGEEEVGEEGEVGGGVRVRVRVQAPKYRDLSALRGAAGSLKAPLTWHEMRAIAREEAVRQVMGEGMGVTDIISDK